MASEQEQLEPMTNERCSVLIHGYAFIHSRMESLPMDIVQLCVAYYSIWFELKIVFCNEENGAIDTNIYETKSFRNDSPLTLWQFVKEIEHKMYTDAVRKRYNELLQCSKNSLKQEWKNVTNIGFDHFDADAEHMDDKALIDTMMRVMTGCKKYDIDWNDFSVEEIVTMSSMPFVHIWMKFKHIKDIYPMDDTNIMVKEEWLANEDGERWVEFPDECMQTKINGLRIFGDDFDSLAIEKCKINDFNEWKTGKVTWLRQKGNDWRESLQVGDFVNVRDKAGGKDWYECFVRYVYPKDHATMAGKCVIHYPDNALFCTKSDEIMDIDSERICKRYSYCIGPPRSSYARNQKFLALFPSY